jgi:hypothetical protein
MVKIHVISNILESTILLPYVDQSSCVYTKATENLKAHLCSIYLHKQDKQWTYKRSIVAHSRYNSCRGKAVSITHCRVCVCVCVCSLSYPACKVHALYYIANFGVSSSTSES